MENILPIARAGKFITDDAYVQVKYFINAENTGNRKIAWHLTYWFQEEILCGQRILRSAPASFRFPFLVLVGLKPRTCHPGRVYERKQSKMIDLKPFAWEMSLGCCWKPRRVFQRREGTVIKRWWCPRVCGEAVKTDLKHCGASSGRPVPMSCTLPDCTYL